jgi:hypothetical protein
LRSVLSGYSQATEFTSGLQHCYLDFVVAL